MARNMTFTVAFERIGRDHAVPDLVLDHCDVPAGPPNKDALDWLANVIGNYVAPRMASRDISLCLDPTEAGINGTIVAGIHNAGDFTITWEQS